MGGGGGGGARPFIVELLVSADTLEITFKCPLSRGVCYGKLKMQCFYVAESTTARTRGVRPREVSVSGVSSAQEFVKFTASSL